jgi:threonine/homoserine/homoserine lactone efflux protein
MGIIQPMPTDSLAAVFIFAFAVGFGAVITPGPVSTAIVSQSTRNGWKVGPLVATGHSLVELALTLLIALGLSTVLAQPGIQALIGLVGGALLLWMGGSMLLGAIRGKVHIPGVRSDASLMSRRQMLVLGVITTLTNPFWYAWWVTVAAGYLAQARALGGGAVAAFYLGHISADYSWNTALSTVVGSGRRWITDAVYRVIMGVCGLFLIYLGVVFLARGLGLSG